MLSAEEILNVTDSENEPKQTPDFVSFYDITWDPNDTNKVRKVKVNLYKLVGLLKKMGFRRYDVGGQSHIIRIVDNVVEECQQKDVIDVFEAYLKSFPDNLPDGVMRDMLISKIYSGLSTFFSAQVLDRLVHDTPIEFNRHTKEAAFFYYENGYVKVTAEKVELLPYNTLDKLIWKSQVLKRKIKLMNPETFNKGNYAKFISNISDNYFNEKTKELNNPKRFAAFKTIVGYLLHSYYIGKLKAVILTDSRISEEASGRSGKTLFMKSLGHILNVDDDASSFHEINGKDFDLNDRFKYQALKLDTKLVHINDVKKHFDFKRLFNDITEGISCQQKNMKPFKVMAKMAISTNLTIRIHGDSAKDRSIEFEMADYYGADFSPEDEFKEWFFRDWDAKEWGKFDNFLLSCVQDYLKFGLLQPGTINLLTRKLQEETCIEFLKYMDDLNIKPNQEFDRANLCNRFKELNPDFNKLSRRRFTDWLRIYGKFHIDIETFEERRSNGIDYIKYIMKPQSGDIDFWDNPK